MLDLLHYRIGMTTSKAVTADHQKRQTAGMRYARSGKQIGGARTNRGGDNHDLTSHHRLGKSHGRKGHRLLILPAPGG